MGFRDLIVRAVPRKKAEPKAKASRKKKEKKPKWGTPEEKYRRLCMLILFTRYTYYCHATSVISEEHYNSLEKLTLLIEGKNRELIHPRSPTCRPGSDVESDYPRSVQDLWYFHRDDPRTLEPLRKAIEWFMEDTAKEFGIPEKSWKNF